MSAPNKDSSGVVTPELSSEQTSPSDPSEQSSVVPSNFWSRRDGKYVCLLCINFVSETQFYAERHFQQAHRNHSIECDGEQAFICKKGCKKKGHYHCPLGCKKSFEKKGDFSKHWVKCNSRQDPSKVEIPAANVIVDPPVATTIVDPPVPVAPSVDVDPLVSKSKSSVSKVPCPHCYAPPMHRKNLGMHMKRKHDAGKDVRDFPLHKGVSVDHKRGIYLITENRNGVLYPVHVQKLLHSSGAAKVFCESRKCMVEKSIADN